MNRAFFEPPRRIAVPGPRASIVLLLSSGILAISAAPLPASALDGTTITVRSSDDSTVMVQRAIAEAAFRQDVPPMTALAMASVLSQFDSSARGDDGALGLFQIRPHTAFQYGASQEELADPHYNSDLALYLLRNAYDETGNDWDQALRRWYIASFAPDASRPSDTDVSDFVDRVLAYSSYYEVTPDLQQLVDAAALDRALAGSAEAVQQPAGRPRLAETTGRATEASGTDELPATRPMMSPQVSAATPRPEAAPMQPPFRADRSGRRRTMFPRGYTADQVTLKSRFANSMAEREARRARLAKGCSPKECL